MSALAIGPAPFDSLDSPAVVIQKLSRIEEDLANRQLAYEAAASGWFKAKREKDRVFAIAMLQSSAPHVAVKKAEAELAAYSVEGAEHEGEFNAIKAVIGVLEQRAMICAAILKAQGRGA